MCIGVDACIPIHISETTSGVVLMCIHLADLASSVNTWGINTQLHNANHGDGSCMYQWH